MEAGSVEPESLSADEITRAVKLVPEIRDKQTDIEHILIGVPVNGHREGGLINRLTDLEVFTKTLFYTVLGANVFGGVIGATLILLLK